MDDDDDDEDTGTGAQLLEGSGVLFSLGPCSPTQRHIARLRAVKVDISDSSTLLLCSNALYLALGSAEIRGLSLREVVAGFLNINHIHVCAAQLLRDSETRSLKAIGASAHLLVFVFSLCRRPVVGLAASRKSLRLPLFRFFFFFFSPVLLLLKYVHCKREGCHTRKLQLGHATARGLTMRSKGTACCRV